MIRIRNEFTQQRFCVLTLVESQHPRSTYREEQIGQGEVHQLCYAPCKLLLFFFPHIVCSVRFGLTFGRRKITLNCREAEGCAGHTG